MTAPAPAPARTRTRKPRTAPETPVLPPADLIPRTPALWAYLRTSHAALWGELEPGDKYYPVDPPAEWLSGPPLSRPPLFKGA